MAVEARLRISAVLLHGPRLHRRVGERPDRAVVLVGLGGLLSLVGGLVLWLKRRAYRRSRSRHGIEDQA